MADAAVETCSKVSEIVLADGLSRRLGRNKAAEPLDGEPLLLRVVDRLSQVTDETVVVVNSEEQASGLPLPESARLAVDLYPEVGALAGIFTRLSAAGGEWGLVVTCDMPFLNVGLLEHMLSGRDGWDAVVPRLDGRPDPTHAAYSTACLESIEHRLRAGDLNDRPSLRRRQGEIPVSRRSRAPGPRAPQLLQRQCAERRGPGYAAGSAWTLDMMGTRRPRKRWRSASMSSVAPGSCQKGPCRHARPCLRTETQEVIGSSPGASIPIV